MKYLPSAFIWTATAITLAVWVAHIALSTPTVTLSHSAWLQADYLSDQHAPESELIAASCVSVDPVGDCNNLPSRYYTTWGE